MTDEQSFYNQCRRDMIEDNLNDQRLKAQEIENLHYEIMDCYKMKDKIGAEIAEENLRQAEREFEELKAEGERLDESVCF